MVKPLPSKQDTRVRFPHAAPTSKGNVMTPQDYITDKMKYGGETVVIAWATFSGIGGEEAIEDAIKDFVVISCSENWIYGQSIQSGHKAFINLDDVSYIRFQPL